MTYRSPLPVRARRDAALSRSREKLPPSVKSGGLSSAPA
ncbi:hypothetical protein CL3_01420 [butyrate-producing bacterium SM4/1]|nr:hypothetical protein CLS_39070 [[Clostridium] cf. saccharolyticum K10]CBL35505.1 hypothetical protein CL3_01420 [butyrate-producing bacterium SM4/1]